MLRLIQVSSIFTLQYLNIKLKHEFLSYYALTQDFQVTPKCKASQSYETLPGTSMSHVTLQRSTLTSYISFSKWYAAGGHFWLLFPVGAVH